MPNLKLIKNITDSTNPKNDNSDKATLLPTGKHPQLAIFYKGEWGFVEFEGARDNIAYLMQYIEFNVLLYNEFQIYLTLESQLCKTILITIASVVESVIYETLYQQSASVDIRTNFSQLIAMSFEKGLIGGGQKNTFHSLRTVRNNIHLNESELREYLDYNINQVNTALEDLEMLRARLEHIFS